MIAKTAADIEASIWNRVVVVGRSIQPHDRERLLVQSIAIELSDMEQRVAMALQRAENRWER